MSSSTTVPGSPRPIGATHDHRGPGAARRLALSAAVALAAVGSPWLAGSGAEAAALYGGFEAPAYALGTFATKPATTNAFDRPFDGTDGWSQSSSSTAGTIVMTADSGLYAGGQAARQSGYIGANVGEALLASRAVTFDVMRTSATTEGAVGGWVDAEADGLYDQASDSQALVGVVGGFFGIRNAGFATQTAALRTAVTPDMSVWYRVVATFSEGTAAADDNSITLDVFDLTNSTAASTVAVDLNGATAGTAFTAALTDAQFGRPLADYAGVVLRTANGATIDNIQPGAFPLPEPGTAGLAAAAASGLLVRRRRRRHAGRR